MLLRFRVRDEGSEKCSGSQSLSQGLTAKDECSGDKSSSAAGQMWGEAQRPNGSYNPPQMQPSQVTSGSIPENLDDTYKELYVLPPFVNERLARCERREETCLDIDGKRATLRTSCGGRRWIPSRIRPALMTV